MNTPKRLLIIDDDIPVRKIVRLCLERLEGWETKTCGATTALHHAKEVDWDAILLEIALLKMDGFTLLKQLQADSCSQSIPVALLTTKVMPIDYRRYQSLDIAGVIRKPFRPVELGQQVSEVLGWTECYTLTQVAS